MDEDEMDYVLNQNESIKQSSKTQYRNVYKRWLEVSDRQIKDCSEDSVINILSLLLLYSFKWGHLISCFSQIYASSVGCAFLKSISVVVSLYKYPLIIPSNPCIEVLQNRRPPVFSGVVSL